MSTDESHRAPPSIESLESVHTFPCPFMIKAIGPNTQEFLDGVRAAVIKVVKDPEMIDTVHRPSAKGRHASVTIQFWAETPVDVQQAYIEIVEISDLKLLL